MKSHCVVHTSFSWVPGKGRKVRDICIQTRNAPKTYFWCALSPGACRGKMPWCSYVNWEAGYPTVWASAWHWRPETYARRSSSNVEVSLVAICLVLVWGMAAPYGSSLLSVSTVSLHCWQIHSKSEFPSWSLFIFPSLRSINDPIIFENSSSLLLVSGPPVPSENEASAALFLILALCPTWSLDCDKQSRQRTNLLVASAK